MFTQSWLGHSIGIGFGIGGVMMMLLLLCGSGWVGALCGRRRGGRLYFWQAPKAKAKAPA